MEIIEELTQEHINKVLICVGMWIIMFWCS